jgi:putative hydroxymethylpyrimidine transport system ATP-binding protein
VAPGIEIVGANLVYENLLLFQNLSLTFAPAKWTCLLGPSGVGKTSLLRLIAGLNTFANSEKLYATDNLPLKNRVAYMAQQESLLPWLTTLENVVVGCRFRGTPLQDHDLSRGRDLLLKVGLEKVMDVLPKALSGGMKQRVMLARTLFENQPIVLMDEPFASLDIITRSHIQELAAELLFDRTVVLVTHDPFEALRLGHHVYIMSGKPAKITSQIELRGPPPRLVTDTELLRTHGHLLEQLSQAKEVMEN